jgi:hypothetical protein
VAKILETAQAGAIINRNGNLWSNHQVLSTGRVLINGLEVSSEELLALYVLAESVRCGYHQHMEVEIESYGDPYVEVRT